ncbi:MAG: MaoC family dehydratase N-terminal domain-containing protein [Dehalococcoidales bacterium]|nr:MaoC family dehydratase N-terminal domain-containing protein [Dehalococcoidales bacterium]
MLPEETKNLIGMSTPERINEIENGAIRKFADAVGESNPLYEDEDYARKSRYGSIIAPPGFFGWPKNPDKGSALLVEVPLEVVTVMEKAGYPFASVVDGGMEYEFFSPIYAGDTLTNKTTVTNIRERAGSTTSLVFINMETVYVNQKGNTVAKAMATMILRSINQQKEQANV